MLIGPMGAISDFVAAFCRDYDQYLTVEKEVEALCKDALRGIEFLWQSRVKAAESLEKKLKDRTDEYKNETENVADVKDLVAGRIILARWLDFEHVEEIVNQNFNVRGRTQHPKHGQNAVNLQARFRGYDGLHFHVTRQGSSDEQSCNPVIEIQVMSAFMWAFSTLEHDITYKRLHGEPDEVLLSDLDLLKGIANLGEIGLQMYDKRVFPVAKLSSQQRDINPDLQATIRTVAAEVVFDEDDRQCLRDLRLTDPRHDKQRIEASKDPLLEGSCSWVLEDSAFVDWWTRDDSRFLWIHGDPGKGKTMMMIALISEVSKRLNTRPESNVLAYFFCQNTSDDLNTTVSVLRGLIYHLVDQEKTLIRHIRRSYDSAGRQLFEGPNALYALQVVLLDMLKDRSLGNVYFMVDALDECDPKIDELLEWIVRENSEVSPKIKWLTTSRNEPTFIERLGRGHQLHTSLELNSSHVARAVHNFIDYKVKELAGLKSYSSELQDFVRKSLLEKAEGTFLWVALVCKELRKQRKQHAKSFLEKIPAGLEPLYERMLDQVLRQENKDDIELCRRILCSVTLAFRPLRLEEIAFFAKIPEVIRNDPSDLEELVGLCGSFITIRKETVYFVHQSAKDYLSDGKRSDIFLSGQEHEHANTARQCLEVMSSTLKKDVCNFQTPGICLSEVEESRIEAHIPFHAQYACLYWVDHFQQTRPTQQETLGLREGGRVHQFFQRHFLHWLEILSLIKRLSAGVILISKLENMLGVSGFHYVAVCNANCLYDQRHKHPDLSHIIYDAKRFALNHRSIIEEAPLQLYVSALLFSPKKSIIRKCYIDQDLPWIIRYPIIENGWSSSLQTLEGHSDWVRIVAFSPDGKQLASGSSDSTVRLWETATGALQQTLEGHSNAVTTVAFSPDGKQLASGSDDSTVRLWETATGALQYTLEGHSDWVRTVEFSPDGKQLASGSDDSTVRLWETAKGALQHTLEGHSNAVMTVAFSPDGKQLASGSDDSTVRLWETATGALQQTLEGHSNAVTTVAFSPDGKQLASGSDDSTVRLWETATGALQHTLEGHSGWVTTVAFSPDGKQLASGSDDSTVRLWETATGALQYTLEGHSDWVRTVAFSPDGKQLASGSSDSTVRLWETAKGALQHTLEGHSNAVMTVAFSPDGKQLASGSDDSTVRLWETAKGALPQTLQGHSNAVTTVAFSPDGKQLASGSDDSTVRLWETAKGALQHTLEGHSNAVMTVAFSPDGKQLASGSGDSTVRLWETATGALQHTLEGHSDWVTTVAFSPDGKQLASGSDDSTVRLWETATGALQHTIEGHSGWVRTVAFSPDGKQLASGSSDSTVRLWETATGIPLRMFDINNVSELAIAADGSYIQTNCGQIQLSTGSVQTQSGFILPARWTISHNWLMRDNRKMLWLPLDFRSSCKTQRDCLFAIGHQSGLYSGQVTILNLLDPDFSGIY